LIIGYSTSDHLGAQGTFNPKGEGQGEGQERRVKGQPEKRGVSTEDGDLFSGSRLESRTEAHLEARVEARGEGRGEGQGEGREGRGEGQPEKRGVRVEDGDLFLGMGLTQERRGEGQPETRGVRVEDGDLFLGMGLTQERRGEGQPETRGVRAGSGDLFSGMAVTRVHPRRDHRPRVNPTGGGEVNPRDHHPRANPTGGGDLFSGMAVTQTVAIGNWRVVGSTWHEQARDSLGLSGPNLEPGMMRVNVTNGRRNGLNIDRKVGPCPGSRRRWVLGSVHALSLAVHAANPYRPRFQVRSRPSYRDGQAHI